MRIEELDDGGSLDSGDRREIVRDGAKRALVGVGGRLLFYPTLLYNLLRNRMQAEFRWWNEVDQYILLGAVPFPGDVPCLQQLGVRGVITLNESYETLVPSNLFKIHGIDHLVIPTRDYLFAPSLMDICRAVDFIHKNASHRRTTYVHCKAGRGRSTTIVLCYLIEYKNMTPIGALEYVRSRRPRVRLAPAQWQAVQEYSRRKLEFPAVQSPKPIYSLTENEVLISADDFRDQRNLLCKASQTRTIIPTNPIGGDEVLVTEADVEGYENFMKFCNEKSTSSDQNNQTIPGGDEYLITLVDLEGCEAFVEVCNEKSISTDQCNQTRPMMRKLSCLFASLKVSARRQPAANHLPAVHAY